MVGSYERNYMVWCVGYSTAWYGMACGLQYSLVWYGVWVTVQLGMVWCVGYSTAWYGMVCGLQYSFIHTKNVQFIADKCSSLNSQIFHARSYPGKIFGMRAGTACFATSLPTFFSLSLIFVQRLPSTNACKHINPHSTLFTLFTPNYV